MHAIYLAHLVILLHFLTTISYAFLIVPCMLHTLPLWSFFYSF
jgi:hypothetical protein